jgi:hypothetical protein
MHRGSFAALLLAAAALMAGCASETRVSPPAPPAPGNVNTAPAAPRYNLAGYSQAFKDGYGDACAKRRDDNRFKADADYQMGWTDGSSMCARR